MSQLTVRCLGGLEVRRDEQLVSGFESSKVRALFAYLITQRDRSFSRDHLAALLWPEKPEEAAKRNLRQALYNLKTALAVSGATPPIQARGSELRIDPELDCWDDVQAFDEARRRGTPSGAVVPHYLAAAVALYRGDFLAGFNIKDSPDFEFWQLAEQERLRDQAVDTLRVLIESYLSRGEFRLGIQYARRLVAIDPLSEHAHRFLIRLYSLSGRRNRALEEYQQLRATLHRELGVEPLEETRELYERVLTEHAPAAEAEESRGLGPLIPLVGRHEPYQQLHESWRSVLGGQCRLTIVEGEAGIGKNRLVKSFLDAASSQRLATVLKGRCSRRVPTAYQPFAEVVKNAVAEDPQRIQQVLEAAAADMTDLSHLVPELRELLPVPPAANEGGPAGLAAPEPESRVRRGRLFECFAEFFDLLCRSTGDGSHGEPLMLLLGELQWARGETFELLEYLLERLAGKPVWILGTRCPTGRGEEPSPLERTLPEDSPASRIRLGRLAPEAVEEIASALVGDDQAGEMADFLIRHGEGLPLAIAEWINSLWDQCVLAYEEGRWRLQDSLTGRAGDLEDLIRKRLRRLPTSTRRLASQAAVMGQKFDARLLAEAADEHPQVVEVGLELMLERWLIRQHTDFWRSGRREHDLVLWAKGARLGNFEFNHRLIWQAVLEEVNPLRRQIMHREFAATLEKHVGREVDPYREVLALHYTEAGEWEPAFGHLRRAAEKALAVSATDTARRYGRQAAEAAKRLYQAARTPDDEAYWRRQRQRAAAALEEIDRLDP